MDIKINLKIATPLKNLTPYFVVCFVFYDNACMVRYIFNISKAIWVDILNCIQTHVDILN